MSLAALILDQKNIRDISPDVLDQNGRLKIMPEEYYSGTTRMERALLGHKHALYGLHTQEVVNFLRQLIAGRSAIEIGSGNGVLAEALRIPATDNRQQEFDEIKFAYKIMGQPTINYGANVERLDAIEAIRKYRPQVVVASWVTHLYRVEAHEAGGNMHAPDEREILRNCETYVMISNDAVHLGNPLLSTPHTRVDGDWIYSRAMRGRDFIGIWRGSLRCGEDR